MKRILLLSAIALPLAACHSGGHGNAPGDTSSTAPFSGIGPDEVVHFTGTEPFWGGQVSGTKLTYTTPDNQAGTEITVSRFAGRGGVSFSGKLDDAPFDMSIAPIPCSDGMSDRHYPLTVTANVRGETRGGCAWSVEHPFTAPART